ncbi:MAG: flagellar brake domain-containing protein [Deltaproteobacteria bacterium]|nr:flagellar brake domain-containing protein [Deltaproteobacteria bacterium]
MEQKEKLAIALGSELNMQVEGMEEKFKSILVGIEAPTYLMVRMQIPTRFRNQIDKGTVFQVRYVYMGNLYGFRAKSLGSVDKPYKITFLSYPEKVESMNIRKALRVSCFIPATLDPGKGQLRGLVMEISKNGTRFTIKANKDITNEVKINDSVKISFPLLGFEGIHTFQGNIKSITSDTTGISFGINFEYVNPSLENMIEDYVRDVLDLL